MAKELADSRQAVEGVGSRAEQQQQLRGMRMELEQAREEVKELQGVIMAKGRQLAQLQREAAAQEVQQARTIGTPRQLQVEAAAAIAAREVAERKLAECKQMMAATPPPPPSAPRPPSPTSVMDSDKLGRGGRECSGRQPGAHTEEWGERLPSESELASDIFVRVRALHGGA